MTQNSQYIPGVPHIHMHYLVNDEKAFSQGFAETEICCHACGKYIIVKFILTPDKDVMYDLVGPNGFPKLLHIKEEFIGEHKNCKPRPTYDEKLGAQLPMIKDNNQFMKACPSWRLHDKPEKKFDLRKERDLL